MDIIYILLKNIRYLLRNKRLITIIMIVLLVFSLCKNIFASEGISTYGLEDTTGTQSYIEQKIVEKTGISTTNFSLGGSKCYLVFYEETTGFYHIVVGDGFKFGYLNSSYPFFYVAGLTNFNIVVSPRSYEVKFYYFTLDENMQSSSITTYYKSPDSKSLNDMFGVSLFNYCNLLFASESIAQNLTTNYCSSFSNRIAVDYPVCEALDSELSTIEYYDIAPGDLYANVSTYLPR